MCRKLFLAAVAVLVALVVIRKTELGSLLQVWWNDAKSGMNRQIPPETRIKQLQVEIGKIDKDLRGAVDQLIRRELDRNELRDQVVALRERVATEKKTLTAMVEALDGGNTLVSFQGQQVKADDLEPRMNRVRVNLENDRAALKNKEEMLRLKDEALSTAEEKINKIKEKKAQLEVLVTKLDLQLEQLRQKQVENAIVVDDTHTARAEALSQEIQRDLKFEELKRGAYEKYGLTKPTEPEAPKKDPAVTRQENLKAAKAALADNVAGEK